ncbi:gluzincin family metallopeptidase [Adhaeribacter pallidiroseus]|uniref:Peptidase MA-like domain-containing protein n=1 Tax=Adhaeribacter pallidiroseus TaxID=2072847 RepID=A0A369QML9_9BACT|nr:hypothetical protein [Adhaeribacter pallidiroseus]RDC65600.1 hypothetical protein AHMF7616_04230 [Adhaeribacter pallidiroseus]
MKSFVSIYLIILYLSCTPALSQKVDQLSQYVGYYEVKEIPDMLLRVYQNEHHKLILVVPGEPDYELSELSDHRFGFKAEENPSGMKLKDYSVSFSLGADKVKALQINRPKRDFATNLTATRNDKLDPYAVDTDKSLTGKYETKAFAYHYDLKDSVKVFKMINALESAYSRLIKEFGVANMPKISVWLYSTLEVYHNAMNTPLAPAWQSGSIRSVKDYQEIRVSIEQVTGQPDSLSTGALVHEYVHLLTLQIRPGQQQPPVWLWEGVAIYKGCCKWITPDQLNYLINGNYPSIMEIEEKQDYGKSYELGYYITEYIVSTWGWDAVLKLIRTGGKIQASLGISPKQFDKDFFNFLTRHYHLTKK